MSSPAIPEFLYFRSDGYFFQMMTSFFSAVVGLRGLVDPSNPLGYQGKRTSAYSRTDPPSIFDQLV